MGKEKGADKDGEQPQASTPEPQGHTSGNSATVPQNSDVKPQENTPSTISSATYERQKKQAMMEFRKKKFNLQVGMRNLQGDLETDKIKHRNLEDEEEACKKHITELSAKGDSDGVREAKERVIKIKAELEESRKNIVSKQNELASITDALEILDLEEAFELSKLQEEQDNAERNAVILDDVLEPDIGANNKKTTEEWLTRSYENTDLSAIPNKDNVIAEALLAQSKALTKLLESSSTNSTDKFLARQSTGKDLPFFYGHPEEWPAFISDYERTTQICQFSDAENMQRLRKFLKADAAKAVQCLMISPNNLTEVIETLKTRFGQAEHIVEALIIKAKSVSNVREDKADTIIEFGTSVANLTATIKALKCDNHLNNPMLLKELESKLPLSYKMQWREWAHGDSARKITLDYFTTWIKAKVSLACELSPPIVKEESRDKDKPRDNARQRRNNDWDRKKQTVGVHAIQEEEEETVNATHDKIESKHCNYCERDSHFTHQCRVLRDATPNDRMKMIAGKRLCFGCLYPGHSSQFCENKVTCGINDCKYKHNRLLHGAEFVKASGISEEVKNEIKEKVDAHAVHLDQVNAIHSRTLMRFLPVQVSGPKGTEYIFAFQDDGSGISVIEEDVTASIGVVGHTEPFCMSTLSGEGYHPEAQSVKLTICEDRPNAKQYDMESVRTVAKLNLQSATLDAVMMKKKYPYLKDVPLHSFKNVKPKMLIGSSHFNLISHMKIVEGKQDQPAAVKSRLGWTLVGPENIHNTKLNKTFSYHICEKSNSEDELNELVKSSFSTEDFGVKYVNEKPRSKEDDRALVIMQKTTKRCKDGVRYQTGLLWKNDQVVLPESKSQAIHRLHCQERKMDKDAKFAEAYCNKIQEYLDKDYIGLVNKKDLELNLPRTWVLPHFGVVNPNKPGKLRLVFDAAAKSHGVCLNDHLCQGPDLNNPLLSVLLRFRQYEFAFAGDIKDMFHRVYIREEDRQAQRFLWRGMDREKQPEVYEMKVMVFGAACSPSSAQFVKNTNAWEHEDDYPEAGKAIRRNFYVDDYLDSRPTEREATELIRNVIEIQAKAGFEVCNWVANSPNILKYIDKSLHAKELHGLDLDESPLPSGRVLGLWWNPTEDKFMFKLNYHKVPSNIVDGSMRPTKRQVLKLVMSVFDPLGFLGHLIVKAKILLQDIWRSKIGWDDEISYELELKWKCWLDELHGITQVGIPRCYSQLIPTDSSIELHVFCDASEKAFAAVAYIRVEFEDLVEVNLVMAKTRVAPLKPMSIPRLELQGALMAARLSSILKQELVIEVEKTFMWTDSTTVLRWLQNDARRFKQFVSHRLGEILEVTNVTDWRWVPSKLNVADDATRDMGISDLSNTSRWFNGPEFLKQEEAFWPKDKIKDIPENNEEDENEMKIEVFSTAIAVTEPDITKHSSYFKLIRVTAWILRFLRNLPKRKQLKKRIPQENLTEQEIKAAEVNWCKSLQRECFSEELVSLHGGKPVSNKSRLYQLSPMLGKDGLIRVKGRLANSPNIPDQTKFPIIMDDKHQFTKMLIAWTHEKFGHQGRETVANHLRKKYWILNRTAAVKKAFRDCQMCKNNKAMPVVPEMGNLPLARLDSFIAPFTNTGLDYFGPFEVVIGRRHEKRWGAIFTCLSTRAVHLEVAHNMTTDAAINAIRRFRNRRGNPKNIYSDNGTNFHGANAELKKTLAELNQEKIEQFAVESGIQWHFNPPSAPHMGGVWERLVGSVKKVLANILSQEVYSEETLRTFLAEAEYIVNSRPLTHMSIDPDDPVCLTPNHFLIGWNQGSSEPEESTSNQLGEFTDRDLLLKNKWRAAQRLADMFWKQWVSDYLPTLVKRAKWFDNQNPVKVGDVVIIVDDQAPRNCWEKGIVETTYPGKDGRARSAEVRTSKGIYRRRPVAKLAVLDVHKKDDEASFKDCTTFIGGKNVADKC